MEEMEKHIILMWLEIVLETEQMLRLINILGEIVRNFILPKILMVLILFMILLEVKIILILLLK